MKADCLAVVFTIFASVSAFAGGGSCQFKADGLHLMKEQAVLGELLQTKLSIVEGGRMGPADSPWDEVIGRVYSFMEFQASSIDDPKNKYLIRVHFNRIEKAITFKSLEVLPVVKSVKEE
ncbi:hypothetical protein N9947_02390 [bacterium]|nr:hypothetical protein [bacterium]MDB4320867.1 hypothetical protein [Akkermansiaceae bacterium]MDC1405018.1 hypothetical protein [Akkermansiaceae bacterium]